VNGTTEMFDFWLCAACLYLYGNDALLSVTDAEDRRTGDGFGLRQRG